MSALSLAPRALYEEVAELLRQRIFARELAPGSWIDEMRLAEEYGISRTPLREALKVLATEGLVTMKMRRGAYVTEVKRAMLSWLNSTAFTKSWLQLLVILISFSRSTNAFICACSRSLTTDGATKWSLTYAR